MTAYRPREIADILTVALSNMPVVVLTGMRQTGKSTLLQHQLGFKERRYVSLDDFAQLAEARKSPERLVSGEQPLTIDEAQRCPELLDVIKREVDKNKRPGRFLLSGSANFAMLKGMTESLAGRAVYFVMRPFTRREITGKSVNPPYINAILETGVPREIPQACSPILEKEILAGGMPSVCLGEASNPQLWFKGFEQTYLERDLRQLSQVSNLVAFKNLMDLTALRTSGILNPSELGRDAKLNTVTTARYLSLMETSFVIYRLTPYLKNRASRLIKSSKVYFSDSGLASYLAGIQNNMADNFRGAMLETYVAQNLAALIEAFLPRVSLHFWGVQGRHEVDFIIESGTKCLAVEVKAASRWYERDISGLKAFLTKTPHCIAAILAYNGEKTVQIGEKLWAVPTSALIS